MNWLNFGNTKQEEQPMERKVVVKANQPEQPAQPAQPSTQVVVHIHRLMGDHPRVTLSRKPFEISKIENGVTLQVNKQAKKADGEGTQLNITAGDRVSQQQVEQLSRQHKVIVTVLHVNDD